MNPSFLPPSKEPLRSRVLWPPYLLLAGPPVDGLPLIDLLLKALVLRSVHSEARHRNRERVRVMSNFLWYGPR